MSTVTPLNNPKDRRVEDERLKRIEDKMDGMAVSLQELVAVQRDVQHIFHRIDRLERRLDGEEERTRKVVSDEAGSSAAGSLTKDIVLAALAAGLGIMGTVVVTGLSG